MIGIIQRVKLLLAILLHKEAPLSVKLLLVAGFFYVIFPLDIIPDQILLAGWLDDLALAILIFLGAMKLTPEQLLHDLWQTIKKKNEPEN